MENQKHRFCGTKVLALILTIVLLPLVSAQGAKAETVLKFKATYGQTEARTIVDMINSMRTSSTDAWVYDENNQKVELSGLEPLTYDYALEKVAMLRAAEIALSFEHQRPNGKRCFSAYDEMGVQYGGAGENIAAGQESAVAANRAWREDDENYSGQGHRRNMLKSSFTAVGIGHVYYQGTHYWVEEFASNVTDAAQTSANDESTLCEVAVSESNIISTSISCAVENLSLSPGESVKLPDAALGYVISGNWSCSGEACKVEGTVESEILDPTVAKLEDGKIIALKIGETSLKLTANGIEKEIPITVKEQSISIDKTTVASIPDQSYTGQQITPSVTVKYGDTTLTQNQDYTLSYVNNTNVTSTARVVITGKGKYTGSKTVYFRIVKNEQKISLSGATISSIPSQTYTGNAIQPSVTVAMNGKVLTRNTDYQVTYSNNVNVGTATVTITGTGKYTGTKITTFTIVNNAVSLEGATISPIASQSYTGQPISPAVTVILDGKTLTLNTDYTVTYSNNVNAGTAAVTVTGKGNYTGTKTASFKITSIRDLSQAEVSYSSSYTYGGRTICPSVSVKLGLTALTEGTDFSVTYNNNNAPGKGVLTVTGIGNYTGTIQKTFIIHPKKPVINGYARKGKKAVLSWTADSMVNGYEIYRAKGTSTAYSCVKQIFNASTHVYRDNKLAKRGKYSYKIRSYVIVDGERIYSDYTKLKALSSK